MTYSNAPQQPFVRVLPAQLGIIALAYISLFLIPLEPAWASLFLLLVLSLLQSGLVVHATAELTGSTGRLTQAGHIVGWVAFVGWLIFNWLAKVIVNAEPKFGVFVVTAFVVLYVFIFGIGWIICSSMKRADAHTLKMQNGSDARDEEQARKARAEAKKQHEQSVRQDARFEVRAYYDAHSEIAAKLSPERLDRYLAEDLADTHPAEKVRERAEKLIEMMREMGGGRTQRWNSEEEIVAHFTEAMQRYGEAGCYSQAEIETLQSEVRMQMHRQLEEFRRGGT